MYTRCPQCLTIYEIDEDALRASLGIVQCGHCSNRFDALQTLSDELPGASHATMPWMDPGERVPTLAVPVAPSHANDSAVPPVDSPVPLSMEDAGDAAQPDEVGDWFASLESELAAPAKVKYADAWLADLVAGPDTASAEVEAAALETEKGESAAATDGEPANAPAAVRAEGGATDASADTTEAALNDDWAVDERYATLLAGDASPNPAPVGESAVSEDFQGEPPDDEPMSYTAGAVPERESADGSDDASPATESIDRAPDWFAADATPVEDSALAGSDEMRSNGSVANEPEAPGPQRTPADSFVAVSVSGDGDAIPDHGEASGGDEAVPAPETETAPSHVYVRPYRRRIGRTTLGWAAGCLVLALLLAAQLAWAKRADLFRDPGTRPWVASVCRHLPCRIGPVSDPARLELLSRDIRPDPSAPGALAISATVRNDAGFPQSWPVVVVTLSNLDNQPVAMRRFRPAEYMPDPARRAAGIAPGDTAAIAFEVADPGQNAVSYHIGFE